MHWRTPLIVAGVVSASLLAGEASAGTFRTPSSR